MTSPEKINILVVDDLPDKLLALETVLEGLGENVVTARSGREALRRLLERDFAVILLDVHMPEMDGLETAAMIRQRKKTEHTPIIFVTAFEDERRLAQGYSLGAVDYILSPVSPEVLRTKVGVFVDLFRMTEQVKRQAEERVALAREQAARAAAEEAARRLRFLAGAGAVLGKSLEAGTTLRSLADLAVPFLADFAVAVLLEPDGGWRMETAGQSEEIVNGALDSLPVGMADLIRRALAESKTLEADDAAGGTLGDAVRSALAIPLQVRGRVLGALVLAFGDSERTSDTADLALAEDLAGRAAAALENARLYRDIQDQDHRKTEFLAMLAHELRNPLAPIRNAVHILRNATGADAGRKWANDVIDRQVAQMARLVDDLLDVSRITRGKVALKTELIDAATAVGAAVETSRPLIDERRHELAVALPPQPVWVAADPARLAQVLGNILNNAAKYTKEGGRIAFTVEREGDAAVFRIRDSGVGIAPEMLPRVFDLFTQIDCSLDRSDGGLGIGLTLVHRLVEMHGGTVQAFSDGPGRGSEFVVRLPAVPAPPVHEPSQNGRCSAPREASGLRVLVVDDNRDSAASLAFLLEDQGHQVRTANDGLAALEVVEDFDPEAVVLDIGLPRLNGYETARRMRAQPRPKPLLLVALTGYGHEENRIQAQAAGFDHHLVKPVDLEVLQQLLAAYYQARQAEPLHRLLAAGV
jgi:signal transduction histidine kinase/DNA-binding response OmpR family regulator